MTVKTWLLAFLVFTVVVISTAAISAGPIKSYGAKLGIARANMDFDHADSSLQLDLDWRSGFAFGMYITWFNSKTTNFLTELHYTQKGASLKVGLERDTDRLKFSNRVDYLSICLLGKLSYAIKGLSPYLVAGPRLDFLLDYRTKAFPYLLEELESTIIGLDIGIGTGIPITNDMSLLIELRYSGDIGNSYDSEVLQVNNKTVHLLFGIEL